MKVLRNILEKLAERPKYFIVLWSIIILAALGAGGYLIFDSSSQTNTSNPTHDIQQQTSDPKNLGTPTAPSKDSVPPPGSPYQFSNPPQGSGPQQ